MGGGGTLSGIAPVPVSVPEAAELESFGDGSPFHQMRISSHEPLRELERKGRQPCPSCKKSILYFCYRCVWIPPTVALPLVTLPLQLVVVKHKRELEGKSTAVHAKLLAPSQVDLVTFDPSGSQLLAQSGESVSLDEERDVLLFPDADAVQVSELDWRSVKRLVVIDGTWPQAKSMLRSTQLTSLKRVKLDGTHQTVFWRYQSLGPHCLSTIEAIHRFYQEYCECQAAQAELRGNLDNLLYIFSYFYQLIQQDYAKNPTRKYTSKHRQDYIATPRTTIIPEEQDK